MTEHPRETSPPVEPTRTRGAPFWLNGALTGVVLTSVLVAALDQAGREPNPVEEIVWILILLLCTSLVRAYAAFVSGRAFREHAHSWAGSILHNEWPLLISGVPAVLILLIALQMGWPMIVAIHAVLVIHVVILLGLGVAGAVKAGYRPRSAVAFGFVDALLGALVVVANLLLR